MSFELSSELEFNSKLFLNGSHDHLFISFQFNFIIYARKLKLKYAD